MVARVRPLRAAVEDLGAADLLPDRKVWRTQVSYVYGHPHESLGATAGALFSAHYRIARRAMQRFNHFWLTGRLVDQRDQWARLIPYLIESGLPIDPPPPDDEPQFLVPREVLVADSAEDVIDATTHLGPVLAYLPWSSGMDETSDGWGVKWVGSDGPRLVRGGDPTYLRAVLVKGVSGRFCAVRISDGHRGSREVWLPFAALRECFRNGGRALSITL